MSNKLTINDLSAFYNIPKQTLRYYDKIGLFKPAERDPDTGYRYYTYEQFYNLNLIRSLRKMGIPIKTVKKYVGIQEIQALEDILKKQIQDIDNQIESLNKKKETTEEIYSKILQEKDKNAHGVCKLKDIPRRYVFSMDTNFTIDKLYECMRILYQFYRISSKLGFYDLNRIILTIDKENIKQGNVYIYNSIGFLLNVDKNDSTISGKYIEGNTHICTLHFGPYSTLDKTYAILFDEIKQNNYKIIGDSVEISHINIIHTKKADDFITEVQIPIETTP